MCTLNLSLIYDLLRKNSQYKSFFHSCSDLLWQFLGEIHGMKWVWMSSLCVHGFSCIEVQWSVGIVNSCYCDSECCVCVYFLPLSCVCWGDCKSTKSVKVMDGQIHFWSWLFNLQWVEQTWRRDNFISRSEVISGVSQMILRLLTWGSINFISLQKSSKHIFAAAILIFPEPVRNKFDWHWSRWRPYMGTA